MAHRGYYTVARRYESYFQVVKTILIFLVRGKFEINHSWEWKKKHFWQTTFCICRITGHVNPSFSVFNVISSLPRGFWLDGKHQHLLFPQTCLALISLACKDSTNSASPYSLIPLSVIFNFPMPSWSWKYILYIALMCIAFGCYDDDY